MFCADIECSQPLATASIAVQLDLMIRSFIIKFYEQWLICDDTSCGNRTRMMSVYGKRCLSAGCRGQMHAEVSRREPPMRSGTYSPLRSSIPTRSSTISSCILTVSSTRRRSARTSRARLEVVRPCFLLPPIPSLTSSLRRGSAELPRGEQGCVYRATGSSPQAPREERSSMGEYELSVLVLEVAACTPLLAVISMHLNYIPCGIIAA